MNEKQINFELGHFNFLGLDKDNIFLSFYIPGQLIYETDELGGLPFSLKSTTGWGSQGMELVFGVRGNLPNKENYMFFRRTVLISLFNKTNNVLKATRR